MKYLLISLVCIFLAGCGDHKVIVEILGTPRAGKGSPLRQWTNYEEFQEYLSSRKIDDLKDLRFSNAPFGFSISSSTLSREYLMVSVQQLMMDYTLFKIEEYENHLTNQRIVPMPFAIYEEK
mgnify:CR=1 FL=1